MLPFTLHGRHDFYASTCRTVVQAAAHGCSCVLPRRVARSQHSNLEDAFRKMNKMVSDACKVPKQRKLRTEPSAATKQKRVEDKRHRSQVKANRIRNRMPDKF